MFNLDPGKLLIISVVAILVLGPDKLPQVARQVGGAWRSFNEFRSRMETEVRSSIPDLPSTSDIAHLAKSPTALLNHLSNISSDSESAKTRPDLVEVWDAVGQSAEMEASTSEPPGSGDASPRPSCPRIPQPTPMVPSGNADLN